ncbi:MAG: hypothetical protein H7X93_07675 [Sphingomonadaceae bacterium]|nr:hypothetical protein [Sphingomonadaceae bacterium]
MMRFVMFGLVSTALTVSMPVHSQTPSSRAERFAPARLAVLDDCPLANPPPASEREFAFGALLGGIAASLAGNLVSGGIGLLAGALDRASREQGFVAEDAADFSYFRLVTPRDLNPPLTGSTSTTRGSGDISPPPEAGEATPAANSSADANLPTTPSARTDSLPPQNATIARLSSDQHCLVLFIPPSVRGHGSLQQQLQVDPTLLREEDKLLRLFDQPIDSDPDGENLRPTVGTLLEQLEGNYGLIGVPSLYIEARLVPLEEGLRVVPVLMWYRDRMPGAPNRPSRTEFHVILATPGLGVAIGDIGAPFAAARIQTPEMAPGGILFAHQLAAYESLVVPSRPTTGYVETTLARYNTLYTARATSQHALVAAQRAQVAAAESHAANPTLSNDQLRRIAQNALDDATRARADAQAAAESLQSIDIGATNVRARFVVVRDANRFLQAIYSALAATAAPAGAAVTQYVTEALTPRAAWSNPDTLYVQALTNIAARQREIDTAYSVGDAGAVARLSGELRVLMAQANEAAAGSNRPLPYPALMQIP